MRRCQHEPDPARAAPLSLETDRSIFEFLPRRYILMIDEELLEILACPETKEPVALAEEELIAALNSRIVRGEVKNRGRQNRRR